MERGGGQGRNGKASKFHSSRRSSQRPYVSGLPKALPHHARPQRKQIFRAQQVLLHDSDGRLRGTSLDLLHIAKEGPVEQARGAQSHQGFRRRRKSNRPILSLATQDLVRLRRRKSEAPLANRQSARFYSSSRATLQISWEEPENIKVHVQMISCLITLASASRD